MYKLTDRGMQKVKRYLAELKAKRKEILDAGKDTADETNLPTVDDIISDIEWTGVDEDGSYLNGWGVTDNYDSDYALELKLGRDFIEASTSINCSEISDESSSKLSSGDSKEMSDIIFDTLFGNTQFPQFDPDLCTEIDDETGDTQYVDRGKSEIVFGYMGHVYKVKVSCID